ncbi:MAG: histidinol-phosphate transaminase [Ornithinimicrobium sp.]|uniref:histidinol-phosphate transaminase n=1 Tax=Ornithinimicrobium sp. TaxID=1977084 RepID=UPI003D9B8612
MSAARTSSTARRSFPRTLLRADLRDFTGYSSARTSHTGADARIWLNANESATPNQADPQGRQRRYPTPQPAELVAALAGLYDTDPAGLVVGRGSDEAIDLLVRALCRPGGDGVVVCSPTFGMYAVSARLHGVPVHDVPQHDNGHTWTVDTEQVTRVARETGSRLVFLASPGNPTGAVVPARDVLDLVDALADQAVVVLDEAYVEYAGPEDTGGDHRSTGEPAAAVSLIEQIATRPTLTVLRTLSKAHGLAGARVGTVLAHPDLAAVLRRVQAPYPVPVPVLDLALAALGPKALADTTYRVSETLGQRTRLHAALSAHPLVRAVYDSRANFLLARCADPEAVDAMLEQLAGRDIVVRDMRHLPGLHDAVRVTAGSAAELDEVAGALAPQTDSLIR